MKVNRDKELKELSRRERELNRPEPKSYFIILFAVLVMIMMIDEFASNAPGSVQTASIDEFFVQGEGLTQEEGAAKMSILTTLTIPISILAVLLNALSDRIGRKPLLIISALGMGVAMYVLSLSNNIYVYMLGRLIVTFFIAQDMHQVYIMEVAPEDKRASYITISGAFGLIGIMLISVARSFNTHNEVLNWRGVFLVPAIVSLAAIVVFVLLARETKPFLEMRVSYLRKTPEEREAEKQKAKADKAAAAQEIGIIPACKYIFGSKQTCFLLLAMVPHGFAMLAFAGFGELLMTSNGMLTTQVNTALLVYPIVGALLAASVGIVADRIGRKKAALVYGIVSIVSLLLFMLALRLKWSPVVIGILYGIEIRSYWSFSGLLGIAFKESVPTRIRASGGSVSGVISTFITIIGTILCSTLLTKIGLNNTVIFWGPIMIVASMAIYLIFCKETKGIDLDKIV